jgi:hypothetical protein
MISGSFEPESSRRQLNAPVIVAMIAVRVMQVPVHQIVNVIAVRDGFMAAARAMLMRAFYLGRAARWIGPINRNRMLIDVITVHVMQVAVVQIIHVSLVADRGMPAVGTMLVSMVRVLGLGGSRHDAFLGCWSLVFGAFGTVRSRFTSDLRPALVTRQGIRAKRSRLCRKCVTAI